MMSARIAVLMLLVVAGGASAEERILSFTSDISVFKDATMIVTETIRVRAEGNRIRRGIFRDFPTTYRDRLGHRYRVGFKVLSVMRGNSPEAYHIESKSNGVRIYIGNKDVYLQRGEYTYTLTYRTNRQLGFFETHDELYWNVTGNGWIFTIDEVTARVRLPDDVAAQDIRLEAYTGSQGAQGENYSAHIDSESIALFKTTTAFAAFEGLTVVVSWPKGIVTEPDLKTKLGYFAKDNQHLLAGAVFLCALLLYFLIVWWKLGRDPDSGVIFPRYVPAEGFSPASMRFVQRMRYDHKTFASAIVNLAAKGYLSITEASDYELEKTGKQVLMAPGEQALTDKLFAKGSHVTLKDANHKKISSAISAHKRSLKRDYEKLYFITNLEYFVIGVVIALAIPAVIFLMQDKIADADIVASAFAVVWTWSVFRALKGFAAAWINQSGSTVALGVKAHGMFTLVVVVLPVIVLVVFFRDALSMVSFGTVMLVAAAFGACLVFYNLLRSPTHLGRKLLDKVEGFREYMMIAEGYELKSAKTPELTPELFERYFPYALALDVEQDWSDQFARVFRQLAEQQQGYQPSWYHGNNFSHNNLQSFASAMGGSLSSAISSSSTAPGSSSGSSFGGGGGGSSGGGGGGGGGGGW